MQLKTPSRHVKARTLQTKSLRFIRNVRIKNPLQFDEAIYVQMTSSALTTLEINKWEGFHFHFPWDIGLLQMNLRFFIPM